MCHLRNIAVFEGIEMDVIHMRGEVAVVAYAVLPKTPLPYSALPVPPSGGRTMLVCR